MTSRAKCDYTAGQILPPSLSLTRVLHYIRVETSIIQKTSGHSQFASAFQGHLAV